MNNVMLATTRRNLFRILVVTLLGLVEPRPCWAETRDVAASGNPAALSDEKKRQARDALSRNYQALVKSAGLSKAGAVIVCIPLPCPDRQVYENTEEKLRLAFEMAKKLDCRIIIVRAPYGVKELLSSNSDTNYHWRKEVDSFPRIFQPYISSGTAKLADSFGASDSPWAYLFRDGEPSEDSYIPDLTETLLLKWLSKAPADPNKRR